MGFSLLQLVRMMFVTGSIMSVFWSSWLPFTLHWPACTRYRRLGRPNSVSAVPLGPGIDIWRSCRFIGGLTCALPGGLGRFLPCGIGADHCRLRHIGWEKCGHGLTSRPRETSSVHFLDAFGTFLVPS